MSFIRIDRHEMSNHFRQDTGGPPLTRFPLAHNFKRFLFTYFISTFAHMSKDLF